VSDLISLLLCLTLFFFMQAISDIFKVRIEIWAHDDIDKAKVYTSINPSEPSDKVVMLCYYYGLHYDALITVDDLHGEAGEVWEEGERQGQGDGVPKQNSD
jgi:hypothetical protein